MPLSDENSVSFIVRIWSEGTSTDSGASEWRGSIEQVESGEKSYFHDLRTFQMLMRPYFDNLGIKTPDAFWEQMAEPAMDPLNQNSATVSPAPISHQPDKSS